MARPIRYDRLSRHVPTVVVFSFGGKELEQMADEAKKAVLRRKVGKRWGEGGGREMEGIRAVDPMAAKLQASDDSRCADQ